MKKLGHYFSSLKFDKKMRIFLSAALIISAMTILTVSTLSATGSVLRKSSSLARIQITTIANTIQGTLESYADLCIALTLDESIQKYLKNTGTVDTDTVNNVRNNIASMFSINADIDFIAIFKSDDISGLAEKTQEIQFDSQNHSNSTSDYFYKGNNSITSSKFTQMFKTNFEKSTLARYGGIRMIFGNDYYSDGRYSVTIYQPVYDAITVNNIIGWLCINTYASGLEPTSYDNIDGSMKFDIAMISTDGTFFIHPDRDRIGHSFDYDSYVQDKTKTFAENGIQDKTGTFEENGRLYVYKQIDKWNYYVVGSISMMELMKDGLQTMLVLVLAIVGMVAISLILYSKLVKKSYEPLNNVVQVMEHVSAGKLDERLEEKNMGEDFQKMAVGFNVMMNQMNGLLEQVKTEQEQMEQMRYIALQSQIQPHFLYNTLECIHWQAAAEGNKEVSTLVKALASYYRLCLSKGKDIIPLSQEIEHVKNYLIIQNMRYGNIINCSISIDAEFSDIQIPKITLQPLVENSIYHGIRIKEGKVGQVEIKAYQEGADIVITVADSGNGMPEEEIELMNQMLTVYDESFGYGVRNVNKRIELLFGTQYGLRYSRNELGGVTARIRLPGKSGPKLTLAPDASRNA